MRATYEDLREKHGFRIVDYKVDNESANRRASASTSPIRSRARPTSRPMSPSPARPTRRSPARISRSASRASSTASATRSSCARACPRRSARSLLKDADYEIYVRDRSPQAHFAGRAYVLPRLGQLGAPLTTVNTAKVVGRRLSRRRPQSDGARSRTTISSSRSRRSRANDIENAGRREGLERRDGRRLRAQQGRRHRLPARSRPSASCSPAFIWSPRGPGSRRSPKASEDDSADQTRHAMDGGLRPRPDDAFRRRRRARDRALARAPPRRSPASRCG